MNHSWQVDMLHVCNLWANYFDFTEIIVGFGRSPTHPQPSKKDPKSCLDFGPPLNQGYSTPIWLHSIHPPKTNGCPPENATKGHIKPPSFLGEPSSSFSGKSSFFQLNTPALKSIYRHLKKWRVQIPWFCIHQKLKKPEATKLSLSHQQQEARKHS